MKEIKLEFDPQLVASLKDFVGLMSKVLSKQLVINLDDNDTILEDKDLYEGWRDSLLSDLQEDCNIFQKLLADTDLKEGSVLLGLDVAESILRACSAIRSQIQQTLLEDVDMQKLEDGELTVKSLSEHQQKGYAVYLFLAGLQELLLTELDPESSQI